MRNARSPLVIDAAHIVCGWLSVCPSVHQSTAATASGRFTAERRRLQQISIDSCGCCPAGAGAPQHMWVASCWEPIEEAQQRRVMPDASVAENSASLWCLFCPAVSWQHGTFWLADTLVCKATWKPNGSLHYSLLPQISCRFVNAACKLPVITKVYCDRLLVAAHSSDFIILTFVPVSHICWGSFCFFSLICCSCTYAQLCTVYCGMFGVL